MLDPRGLEALSAVVRQGGFEAAARFLGLTQSAVSQRIKSLEQAAGQPVLTRAKPPQPTPAGTALLSHFQRLQVIERDLYQQLPGLGGGEGSVVPLAVNADGLASWFADVPVSLWEQLGVFAEIVVEDEMLTLDALKSGQVMGAVSAIGAAHRGCVSIPLGAMRYIAVAGPMVKERWFVDAPDWDKIPVVAFTANDTLHHDFLARAGAGEARPPEHLIPNLDAFHNAAAAGIGYCLAAELHVRDALAAGTLVRISPVEIRRPLFWHCWGVESELLCDVTAIVRDAAAPLAGK